MDFRHQISSLSTLSSLNADALLLIVSSDAVDANLDPKLRAPLNDAMAQGDFQLKAGRSLYLHRLPRVKAARVLVSAGAGVSAKAFKAAAAQGFSQLKGLGAKHVAVALVGAGDLDDAHAEALVSAATDAVYLYRHTKPSAPSAPLLNKITLVCDKRQAKAVQ